MVHPLLLRIRKGKLKITGQSCCDLVELEDRDVAAWAGVISESELEGSVLGI